MEGDHTMSIKLRLEQPEDYRQTENMTREAFWNIYSPGCCEHYLLHVMRSRPAFVGELDYVAKDGDRIIGNVVCVKGIIHGDDGQDYQVMSLGPISVLPQYQRSGVGRKMIEHTKEIARNLGYRAILLCGDPDYYSRRGFIPAEELGIRTADNMYAAALQACELYKGALNGISGRYVEDGIYEADESAVNHFDQEFPEKEKISGTPSQLRFLELAAMRRSV